MVASRMASRTRGITVSAAAGDTPRRAVGWADPCDRAGIRWWNRGLCKEEELGWAGRGPGVWPGEPPR